MSCEHKTVDGRQFCAECGCPPGQIIEDIRARLAAAEAKLAVADRGLRDIAAESGPSAMMAVETLKRLERMP